MNLQMKRKPVLAMLLLLLGGGMEYAAACTNLIVGKKASADGSVMVTYSGDDFGWFGYLRHYAAGRHPKGTMRPIYNYEDNCYLGEIEEAAETYNVVGHMNEHQLTITETTFGGREELTDTTGLLDYGSLMSIALQRCTNARQAIRMIADLADRYGYCSEGESLTIADKNEAWIMDLIGKGPGRKGIVWVAVRIPDDCISGHANHSRIHTFPLRDKENCMYAKDVITFAREKGYFTGKRDADFSFSQAYDPATFGALRFCEARVWSYFNRWASQDMAPYLPYASGTDLKAEPMPLYVRPKARLTVADLRQMMRDHYEGTPFEMTGDAGMGPFEAPYRPTPLTWECDGQKYFNERPISTQQAAFVLLAQMRDWLPDYMGGVLWFGCDDATTMAFTPVYACTTQVPDCYSDRVADGLHFSMKSAFWVCNWVAALVRPNFSMMYPDLVAVRDRLERDYDALQAATEQQAQQLAAGAGGEAEARRFLSDYSCRVAQGMLHEWTELGAYLMVKYNDGIRRPEQDGRFLTTPAGTGVRVQRPGYPERYRRMIVEQTGNKYKIPH